jgi:hypothetical protein
MNGPERVSGNRGRTALLSALTAAMIGVAAAGCGDDAPEEQAAQPKAEVVSQTHDGARQGAGVPNSYAHGSPAAGPDTEGPTTAEQGPAHPGQPGTASGPGSTADITSDSGGQAGATSGPGSTAGLRPGKPRKPPREHSDQAPANHSDPGNASGYDGRSDPSQGPEYHGPRDP